MAGTFSAGEPTSSAEGRSARVQEIVEAARRCFAQRGYHETTIRDIAREAGIKSPSILHYHFSSKEQLFLAVVNDTCDQIAASVRTRTPGRNPGAVLDSLDNLWVEIDARPEITPLLVEFCSAGFRDEGNRRIMAAFLERMNTLLLQILDASMGPAVHLLPVPREVLAATVLNLIEGHAIHCAIQGLTPLALNQRRQIRNMLLMMGTL